MQMTTDRVLNVLFLCTHNSARSVLAECVMNRLGKGRFHGWSAGSMPSGRVHPMALDVAAHRRLHQLAVRLARSPVAQEAAR